jgi:predicted dehydrogenase
MGNGKVKVAVIGLRRGMEHVKAFQQSDKAELSWVVDLDEKLGQETAAKYDCRFTTKLEDVFADVDAVAVSTPHFLHHEHGMAVIRAGKHVLIEKPLANTRAESEELAREADARGLKFVVGMQLRFLPAFQFLKQAVESGDYGVPISADVWQEGLMDAERGEYRKSKSLIGGGVLFSMGCHYLDMMLQLLGEPVDAFGVGSRVNTEWMEGEGTAQAIVSFKNGSIGHLVSSWGFKYRNTPGRIFVHMTKALLMMDVAMRKVEIIDDQGRHTLFEETPLLVAGEELKGMGLANFLQNEDFTTSILEDTVPYTNVHSALTTFRTIWKIYDRWEQ